MKKIVALLAALVLIFAGYLSYPTIKTKYEAAAREKAQAAAQAEAAATVHYDELYASHSPEEVIGTVNGRDVAWEEYYSYFKSYAGQVEQYMAAMNAYYGASVSWNDTYTDGMTFDEVPSRLSESELKQYAAIDGLAAENGISLSAEDQAAVDEQIHADMLKYCGEDATQEDFEAFLSGNGITPAGYRRLVESSFLSGKIFSELYGEDGAAISDEDALKYIEDNGYMRSTHILFMTMDPSTGETVDEDTVRSKKAKAQEIYEELTAIEDDAERLAKFNEYKAEFCEDTGKVAYPDGYVFTPGTMVEVYENTTRALAAYEVSEPVESSYGYHVIMTLPLKADTVLKTDEDGCAVTAKSLLAEERFSAQMAEYSDTVEFTYADGFKAPLVTEFRH